MSVWIVSGQRFTISTTVCVCLMCILQILILLEMTFSRDRFNASRVHP